MESFLKHIAQHVFTNYKNTTENLCVVLPNKRGALYLKQHLAKTFNKTIWLPSIISAEEFVAQLSNLQLADGIDLICDLYTSYCHVLGAKAESFDAFAKWGNLMLQDFNECDRYLVDTKNLYQNLKEIKEIENWSLNANNLTETQQDYCNFMFEMGTIYEHFTKTLLQKKQAYQGLMYREAVKNYINSGYINKFNNILFAGFNALNKAEILIFNDLIKTKKAEIIWDADNYYLQNEAYEAGLFLRKNFKIDNFNTKNHIGNYFKEIPKNIDIVAVPKQIGQSQIVFNQLSKWIKEGKSLTNTAIILADESLLFPVLHQLPKEVDHVNITMEYPLRLSPIYDLIDNLINLQITLNKNTASKSYYYLDVFKILQNTLFKLYYQSFMPNKSIQQIIQQVIDNNYVWINNKTLELLFGNDYSIVTKLFINWQTSTNGINCIATILKNINTNDPILTQLTAAEKEYIHVFTNYFNRLQSIITTHSFLNSLLSLKSLFKQIIGTASVPFIGEPLKGLQIMGVLETRTLDFENIMLLGVNEGVLPSGKTSNSFIPNDLKRHHNMPLYGDKDAIYAYHFYRLLQRATNIVLTYNTETSLFGTSEKSRFLTQLQFELSNYNTNTIITEKMLSGDALPASTKNKISIVKNEQSLKPILAKLTVNDDYSGLSPSALISYKDCGLKFYFRYGAGIKETEEVEENAEASTFGTILHKALELLYIPFIGRVVTDVDLKQSLEKIDVTVKTIFTEYFTLKETLVGKNYLQQQVLIEYVKKLLQNDLKLISQSIKLNEYLTIIDLEKKLSASVFVTINGITTEVFIKGSADRVDKLGSQIRIIDYKSSTSIKDKFKFTNFDDLFTNSDYNKMLQLFMYAWLAVKNNLATAEQLSPCIIAFKQFSETPKIILNDDKKNAQPLAFTTDLLLEFESHLKLIITQIINSDTQFTQTDNADKCAYCSYATICNVC